MIAIIHTGGKQYLVKEGESLRIEKLEAEVGSTISLPTLLVAADDASTMELGKPHVAKEVTAEIEKHGRAEKILVRKFKAKVRYSRTYGHRQPFTQIKITKIA